MSETVTLAPAILVRAAAWPTRALDELGDAGLGVRARALATSPRPGRRDRSAHHARRADEQGFEALYARVLERDRAHVLARTAQDPRFVHALWLSNPALAAQLGPLREASTFGKRERHRLTTLYRYLARAAGRATPCDAWSSVSVATLGPETSVRAGASRLVVAPDLRPFQAIARALGRRPSARRRARFAVSPLCAPRAEGGWTTWARVQGFGDPRAIAAHPIADRLLAAARAARRPLSGAELLEAAGPEADTTSAERVLGALIEHGFLVGGLDLPARFASPWRALERVGRALAEPERVAWRSAISALRSVGERVAVPAEGGVDALDRSMARSLDDARAALSALTQTLCVKVEVPRALLRVDRVGDWSITLGPELTATVRDTVAGYEALQQEQGLGLAFRAAARAQRGTERRLDALTPEDAAPPPRADDRTWEAVVAALPDLAPVQAAVARWAALASAPGESVTWTLTGAGPPAPSPPIGVLMLAPLAHPDRAGRLRAWVQGLLDEPTTVHARFAWALGGDPLTSWFASRFRALTRARGLDVFAYATWAESHPNVAAQPAYVARAIEPWGAGGSRRALNGMRVERDATGLVVARAPGWPRPLVVAHLTAAHTVGDPAARVLLPTTFRDAPLHSVQASTVPFEVELTRTTPTPALLLSDGSVARARRLVLQGETLDALLEASGAERFLRWQAIAARAELPERVVVRRDGEPPMVWIRDSPLALDAALEGARGETRRLLVELPPAEPPWLIGPDGARYVSELAVPFERARHGWSLDALAPGPTSTHGEDV